jgi:Flp pilus assembly protein TadG
MTPKQLLDRLRDREGATLVFVALSMVVLLGVAGLAIDVGYAFVVRAELQNAADSAALAGARALYTSDGSAVNPGANAVATDWATRNQAEQLTVTVESVERGHWRFSDRTFEANETTMEPPDLERTTAQLDDDMDFVNAVRVVTRRSPDASGNIREPFFAGVFGAGAYMVRASAVAYIGFPGTLAPGEARAPIAVSRQALLQGDSYSTDVGRVLTENSGATSAAWTNFAQPCAGAASDGSVRSLIGGPGNAQALMLGQSVETNTRVSAGTASDFRMLWRGQWALDTNGDGYPDRPWRLRVPVIDSIGSCGQLVGAVEVDVLWPTSSSPFSMSRYPTTMYDPRHGGSQWTCTTTGAACFGEFAAAFDLQTAGGSPATWQMNTVYFLPAGGPHSAAGLTGGRNFGILARVPVLVR